MSMTLTERLRSDAIYLVGILRVLRRTTPIGKNPNRSFRELIEEKAAAFSDRVALIGDRETLTYSQLDRRANAYARWAQSKGLRKGDVVALAMPNRPDYVAIWMGIAKMGGVTALINTNLTGASLGHCVSVVNAKMAIVDVSLLPAIKGAGLAADFPIYGVDGGEFPRFDEEARAFSDAPLQGEERPALTIEDRCVLIYTSGTTGLPKAANMNHYRVQLAMLGFTAIVNTRETDRVYDTLPLYHSAGGLLGTGVALMVGGSTVIKEKFSAREFWPDVKRHGCTVFCYIGELCRYLVNSPPGEHEKDHAIRVCFGNGIRPDVWGPFQQRFAIPEIREYYAATEGNCNMFNFDSKPGAVGRIPWFMKRKFPISVARFDVETEQPVRGPDGLCVECAAGEVGELIGEIVNDPTKPGSRFEGYADKAATEKKIMRDVFRKGDAWFRSGDLVRRDEDNYFYFVDRIGDTFRWKGENVSTNEVSERLTGFPGLVESVVYGVAIPGKDGRAGMIALTVEDAKTFDLEGFRAHIAAELPEYARPVFIRIRQNIDVTGTFKQRKVDLVGDGYDVSRVFDPVWFNDLREARLIPLDLELCEKIASGAQRV